MRLAAFGIIGALGLAGMAVSAQAAPFAPAADHANPRIIQVWGGCGPAFRPIPGHWARGYWVPPHCAPIGRPWGPPRRYWHRYW